MENNRLDGDIRSENEKYRNDNGTFKEGNKFGSFPRKLSLNYFTRFIRKDEKLHPGKKTLLRHYKERLYRNDNLLAKLMDKYMPTTTINELTGGGEPININIIKKIYSLQENKNEPWHRNTI